MSGHRLALSIGLVVVWACGIAIVLHLHAAAF